MKTKAQEFMDAVILYVTIRYVKDIEDLSKKIEESVKKLDASSEKLLEYDYKGIEESEKALKQLKQQVDELDEKLKDQDKMIIAEDRARAIVAEDPRIRAIVGSAVDNAKEIMEGSNKAIDRLEKAMRKFEEGLSDPYIGEMIRRKLKAEESRVKEMLRPY
jgi:uncharacterized protein Yka (UPF0111/DUF47 family)